MFNRLRRFSPKRAKRSGKAGNLGIVRLYGPALEVLRWECYRRDRERCISCGRWVRFERGYEDSMHMAHRRNKRMYGDHIEQIDTKCGNCHLVKEHNPKSCPSKR